MNNQGIYCSIICPLLVQTLATGVTTTLGEPGVFLAALPTEGLLKAIGIAGASMTGPTDTAMEQAIAADAAIPAKRALNAFEVGVVGLLNIIPALPSGPGAVLTAIQQFRQQTFDALNAPVVPNPTPTVMPHGVFQVAVIGAINVVASVIFPAFNDVLAGAFQVPNAVAQELATSGDPVRAFTAGLTTAVGVVNAAGTVIANTIVTELNNVRNAAMQPASAVPAAAPKLTTLASASTPQVTTPTPVGTPKLTTLASTGTPKATTPTVGTSTNPKTTPLSQTGGQFHNPLAAVTPLPPFTPKSLTPPPTSTKPATAIKPDAQSTDRGSHAGLPSRPAFRANR
ncbi:MAG: hypothetical protein P4L86_29855 [Mycobacterium sp.]|nr:hypothetical protein [Mycobacterium sp.]